MKISLCIPTNGIVDWISKVIDSIYTQNVNLELFEVVIVDNGNNQVFFDYIHEKMSEYTNIRYKRIECSIFMNEIESYKLAEGDFIKFINHRTVLMEGTLEKWISFMEKNVEEKPIIYFSNGVLDRFYDEYTYDNFDDFIRNLSYWSSWSTGMSIWKEDIKDLKAENCNELFPHTEILFKNHKNRKYIIDNRVYLYELPHTSKNKGKYDLFYAFSVEYLALVLRLYQKKDISSYTFVSIKSELIDFIISLYQSFCEKKEECSYDISGYDDNIQVFYTKDAIEQRISKREEKFEAELKNRLEKVDLKKKLIAVWGAGVKGRMYVQQEGKENIICFIDSDLRKQHTFLLGIPIVSIDEFVGWGISVKVKICVGPKSNNDIKELLLKKGIECDMCE